MQDWFISEYCNARRNDERNHADDDPSAQFTQVLADGHRVRRRPIFPMLERMVVIGMSRSDSDLRRRRMHEAYLVIRGLQLGAHVGRAFGVAQIRRHLLRFREIRGHPTHGAIGDICRSGLDRRRSPFADLRSKPQAERRSSSYWQDCQAKLKVIEPGERSHLSKGDQACCSSLRLPSFDGNH